MRKEISKRHWKMWAAVCALALLSASSPGTRGDDKPVKGRTLLDVARQASVIVLGHVESVSTDGAGVQRAVVSVKRAFRGQPGSTVTVLGSVRNPDEARFNPNRSVLLFLAPTRAAGVYQCVKGDAGKYSVFPGEEGRVAELAEEYAKYSAGREPTAAAREGHRRVVRNFIAAPLRDRHFTAGLLEEFDAGVSAADLDWLKERARDEKADPTVRAWAARHLGRLRAKGEAPTLLNLVSSPEPLVRGGAVWALGALGAVEHEGVILKALDDPSPGVRQTAVEVLGKLKSPNSVGALMRRLEQEPSTLVRAAIVTSVGNIPGEEARRAVERLGGPSVGARLRRVTRGGERAEEPGSGESPEARPTRFGPEPRPTAAPSDDPPRNPRQRPGVKSDDPAREEN